MTVGAERNISFHIPENGSEENCAQEWLGISVCMRNGESLAKAWLTTVVEKWRNGQQRVATDDGKCVWFWLSV